MGQPSKKITQYYFIGIGGIGMGTLAMLLRDQGHIVSGSDVKESCLTAQLREKGAQIFIGHRPENLHEPDYVVVSSAIPPDNSELLRAKVKGITLLHRAELLAQVMNNSTAVTVAGAHGKTTTSAMASALLLDAGLQPTVAVGGVLNNMGSSARVGGGDFFVAEVDESDGSFLHFHPFYSIVTNMDCEHMDYYQTWEAMARSYEQFLSQTHRNGAVILCGDDESLTRMIPQIKGNVVTYGLNAGNRVRADHLYLQDFSSRFLCQHDGVVLGPVELQVPGVHNIVNSLAVVALSRLMAIDFLVVQQSLKRFQGVQRRFTTRGNVAGVLFVDDYAHHPTEIQATLAAARLLKRRRVIAIVQPHRFSRIKLLQREFIDSMQNCDYLILTDIYAASETPLEGVSAQSLCDQARKQNRSPVVYLPLEAIGDHLISLIKPGDLVITLGAGNINSVLQEVMSKMNTREDLS